MTGIFKILILLLGYMLSIRNPIQRLNYKKMAWKLIQVTQSHITCISFTHFKILLSSNRY